MTDDSGTAVTALAELVQRRAEAQARVDQVEAEQRAAGEAREAARVALIQFERAGSGSAAERAKLEKRLVDAEDRASQRWSERLEGGRQHIRDCQRQVQLFTAEHLDVLVENLVRDGEAAAAAVNEAAAALVEAYGRREAISSEIAQVIYSAGVRLRPGDITRSRADQAASAASVLIQQGGEEPPRLRRDPREPMLGAPAEASAA